jgi:protein disulfide-isomerase A1
MAKAWLTVWALIALLTLPAFTVAHAGHDHDHDEDDETETTASEVAVLSAATFDAHIAANEVTLVEFYAPWCGHCKQLAPEYDKASIELSGVASLAKVDCTEHRELCSKYEVQGFPTIKLFRNDGADPQDYDQARSAAAIVKFMQKQKQAAYTTLTTASQVTDAANKDGISVIAYIPAADQAAIDVFVSVARSLRNDYEFSLVTDSALGVTSAPRIVLHRKFDAPTVTYGGSVSVDGVSTWVRTNAFPLVGEIGPENYQKYVERALPLAWLFLHKENDQAVLAAAKEVAPEFASSLSIVWLDGVRWADHGKTFGLNGATPGVVIEDRTSRKNYVLPQTGEAVVNAAALRAHFAAFVSGTLTATLKSEAVPESNDGPVKTIVGTTFDAIVNDATKDVLVEFYAPWCGHCKTLAPKYEKLGEMFASDASIVIAKVDATENDTPADIKGFPTLMLYSANAKDAPVTYNGDRTEQAMAKWLRENASTLKKGSKKAAAGAAKDASHDEL